MIETVEKIAVVVSRNSLRLMEISFRREAKIKGQNGLD